MTAIYPFRMLAHRVISQHRQDLGTARRMTTARLPAAAEQQAGWLIFLLSTPVALQPCVETRGISSKQKHYQRNGNNHAGSRIAAAACIGPVRGSAHVTYAVGVAIGLIRMDRFEVDHKVKLESV